MCALLTFCSKSNVVSWAVFTNNDWPLGSFFSWTFWTFSLLPSFYQRICIAICTHRRKCWSNSFLQVWPLAMVHRCFKIINSKTLTFSSNIHACTYYESKLDYGAWRVNGISTTCTAAAKKIDEDIAIYI